MWTVGHVRFVPYSEDACCRTVLQPPELRGDRVMVVGGLLAGGAHRQGPVGLPLRACHVHRPPAPRLPRACPPPLPAAAQLPLPIPFALKSEPFIEGAADPYFM